MDPRSGATTLVAEVRRRCFGVDGGTLFARLGFDAVQTSTAGLRTGSCGGAEMAGDKCAAIQLAWRYQAQIHWLDEMGLRSDHQVDDPTDDAANTCGLGDRAAFPMQHDLGDHQSIRFGVHAFRQRFTARVFLNFLGRLLRLNRKSRRKVFLILDSHPVHKARSVSRWLAEHVAQIQVFAAALQSRTESGRIAQPRRENQRSGSCPSGNVQRMSNVRSYLRITQARPRG